VKKLLLLGGSRYILPVIRVAHELDVYVITADYLPDNIAHKYSDEYVNVSVVDKEAVLEVARSKHIDGIMSFACDPGVVTAAYVAEQMGLPSVGSYKSVSILQDKGRFRKFLKDNGFNVPESKTYKSIDEIEKDKKAINYPSIVKPVDNAGSKGVKKVDSYHELITAANNAFENSRCGMIIVEDFLQPVGNPSDSDWFSIDGNIVFYSFNSQLFVKDGVNPYVPAGFYWKSTMSESAKTELLQEIQRLIKLLDLKTSIYNVEVRECSNGKAYIMEVSPRGGGNRLAECIELETEIRIIEASVRAALGFEINEIKKKGTEKHIAELILHSEKKGSYEQVKISKEIINHVVEKDIWINAGEIVEEFSGANKSIGTIIFEFDNEHEMQDTMCNIDKYVKIIVKDINA
jgi:carbamoylphosphate synthase large subunit